MADEFSFDVVSKIDLQEVDNAINQGMKEISTRYDFRGSKSSIARQENTVTIIGDDEYKLKSVNDILQTKLSKRGIPLKGLTYSAVEQAAGDSRKQTIELQQGIPTEKAKEMVKMIKNSKVKVQAAIMGDHLRVSGKSKDDLQSIMAMLKAADYGIAMQFDNYR